MHFQNLKHPLLSTSLADKTGLEVLHWIRSRETSLRILPVILLAGSAQEAEMLKALDLGAYDYVLKTLRFEEALEWVNSLQASCLQCGPIYSSLISYLIR